MLRKIYMKATAPPKKQELLPRTHLNDLLSEAVHFNLINITAGAGYGKTQTIAMLLKNAGYKGAWLQFSKLDNNIQRFWKGFLYALSVHRPTISAPLEQLAFPESLLEFDHFLHIFAKGIYEEERFILVFDDFHLIHDISVINFIENLVAANIENICIILLSRYSNNISTWSTACFTEADLSFSLSETKEYLKMQAISLAESDIEKIHSYTEGWPLAIYLVGLHLKEDDKALIDPLFGTMPTIFQLVDKEIYSHYTPDQQEFLIKLSLLEEFPADLIHSLSTESVDTITDILNANMFINYNSYTRKYLFHHIFLDFLQKKQFSLSQPIVNEVYLLAANWYERHESKFDALMYYNKCGNYNKIWEIILQTPPDRHPKDVASQVIYFLSELPEEFIQKHPMVRVVRASFLLNNLELKSAQTDLSDLIVELNAMPENEENTAVIGEAYIILTLVRLNQKKHDYVKYCKLAAACLPHGSMRDYRNLKIIGSNTALNLNSLEKEEVERFQIKLFEAVPYISKAMHGFGYGVEYLATAEVTYFKGNYKKAQEYAFEAIYRARQKKQHDIVCNAYFLLMRITATKGDYNATLDYMGQSREYANEHTSYLSILDIADGWFFIRIGREEKVARWLLNDSLNAKILSPISVGRDRLIRAYYFLEKERYDELLGFAGSLDSLYREKGLWLDLVTIRIFKAISLYYTGDLSQCMTTMKALYDDVSENHFIMQFVEMGRHMRNMIDSIRKTNHHNIPDIWLDSIYSKSSTYAKRQAFYKTTYNTQNGFDSSARFQLTSREEELLKSLCQGLTREEIAESLYISLNTVKSSLQNIYGKLGAVNSVDAVRIAMQMKII